jgi:hypothetical protein
MLQGADTATHTPPLEYVVPDAHAVHWRLMLAAGVFDWPKPAVHVAHGAHVLRPGDSVNVPIAQSLHTRSLVAVAAMVMYVPAAHATLTAVHATILLVAENVAPATHAEHWRSTVLLPSVARPWPAGHVLQVVHATSFPTELLKWPSGHVAHVLSEMAVAALSRYLPAAHSSLTGVHSLPSSVAENEMPTAHAAHWRFAIAEPTKTIPCPAAHTAH